AGNAWQLHFPHFCQSSARMNESEREAIILNSAWEMIDGLVNWAIFEKTEKIELSNLWIKSSEHRQLFLILLADFLSQTTGRSGKPVPLGLNVVPNGATPANKTFLFHLRQVCAAPNLGHDISGLSQAVEAFAEWLETEFVTEGVNLHSIDRAFDLKVSRLTYIKICGDIAKHSLGRLEGNVKRLRDLLESAEIEADDSTIYLAFETFYEWFADNIFIYHLSHIAELLNNIRWEIYHYLLPEYQRSWHESPGYSIQWPMYGYHVPESIKEPVAVAMYWGAMERTRAKPYFQRFVIPDHCKRSY
ncbi:MAG: hypothetical protein ABI898_07495, partial [Sphingomonadales bacterium]